MDLTKHVLCREQCTPPDVATCISSDCARAFRQGAAAPTTLVVRGYTVTVIWKKVSSEDAAEKRSVIAQVLARNLPK